MAIAAALGTGTTAADNVIIPDGRTDTRLDANGRTTDVRTNTVRGRNGFNSFHHFKVAPEHTVNLRLPSGTRNLINLVHDSRAVIEGTLNGVLDGRIGGHVVFADPHGIIVGASGVVNVGSLLLTTPTQSFMDEVISPDGRIGDKAVDRLLAGEAPDSGAGVIRVDGEVNAAGGIVIEGTDVAVNGSLRSASPEARKALFEAAVNTEGLEEGFEIVQDGGVIAIRGAGDVTLDGTVDVAGAEDTDGGTITVRAGRDVELRSGAELDASGGSGTADGGVVDVWADRDATTEQGVAIGASAGDAGDGGFVELSAERRVTLAPMTVDVSGAGGGEGGLFYVDPDDIVLASGTYADDDSTPAGFDWESGTALLEADESITLESGAVVTADDGGNITLRAPRIEIQENAALEAYSSDIGAAGDILLEAIVSVGDGDGDFFVADNAASARIDIDGALQGRNVTVTASATATSRPQNPIDAVGEELPEILATELGALKGELPADLDFALAMAEADAVIDIGSTAEIRATGDVTLNAAAERTAEAVAGTQSSAGGAAAALAWLGGESSVTVAESASLRADGVLSLSASSNNLLLADADVAVSGTGGVALGGSVALGFVDTETTVSLLGEAPESASDPPLVSAGEITLASRSKDDFQVDAATGAGSDDSIGIAAAVLDVASSTRSHLGGHVRTDGALNVLARSEAVAITSRAETAPDAADAIESEAKEWYGFFQGLLDQANETVTTAKEITASDGTAAEGGGDNTAETTPGEGSGGGLPLALGGAMSLLWVDDVTEALLVDSLAADPADQRLAASGVEVGAGDVSVVAHRQVDRLANQAVAAAVSSADPDGPAEDGGGSSPVGIAAALAYGDIEHATRAAVGDQATLGVDRTGVAADLALPAAVDWGGDEAPGSLDELAGEEADLEGRTTSHAGVSVDGAGDVGLSGAVSVLLLDSEVDASVGASADVTLAGDGGAWEATLDDDNGGDDPWTVEWADALDVAAEAEVGSISLAGGSGGAEGIGVGGGVNWDRHVTDVRAGIGAGASITGTGDAPGVAVTAARSDLQVAATDVSGESGGQVGLGAAVALGIFDVATTATISDADLSGVGAVTVDAEGASRSETLARSSMTAGGNGVAATLALGQTDIADHAELLGGTLDAAGDVTAAVRSAQDYRTEAFAAVEGSRGLGLAAAIADRNSTVGALLTTNVTSAEDLAVLALSVSGDQAAVAETAASDPAPAEDDGSAPEAEVDNGTAGEPTATYVNDRTGTATESGKGQGGPQENPGTNEEGLPLQVAGAVSVTRQTDHTSARLRSEGEGSGAGDPPEVDASGNVTVAAWREAGGLQNAARAGAVSQGREGGSGVTLGAAVAVGLVDNTVAARIGNDRNQDGDPVGYGVAAGGSVGVHAELALPARDDPEAPVAAGDVAGAEDRADVVTSEADAALEGDAGTAGIAGAVSYLALDGDVDAELMDAARVRAGGSEDYTVGLDGEDYSIDLAGGIGVTAIAGVASIDYAGTGTGDGGRVGAGGAFAWQQRSTDASARVGKGTDIDADAGGVMVAAERSDRLVTVTSATGSGGESSTVGIGAAVALSRLDGDATATIASGADVDAAGTVAADAAGGAAVETLAASEMITLGKVGLAGTVAFTDLEGETRAELAAATTDAGAVRASAVNSNAYHTEANATTKGGIGLGFAAAIAEGGLDANARLGGTVLTDGDVAVTALSLGEASVVLAGTGVAPNDPQPPDDSAEGDGQVAESDNGTTGFVQGRADGKADTIEQQTAMPGKGTNGTADNRSARDLKLAGALALSDTDHTASARIADNATVAGSAYDPDTDAVSPAGDVTVAAYLEDAGVQSQADARARSRVRGQSQTQTTSSGGGSGGGTGNNLKAGGGTGIAASGAVALDFRSNTAEAIVGEGVVIEAARVGVGAEAALPISGEVAWGEFLDLEAIQAEFKGNDESPLLDKLRVAMRGYASATAETGQNDVGLAGAVNYAQLDTNAHAWIGEDSRLTATADDVEEGWTTTLTDERDRAWSDVVTVHAASDTRSLEVAGNINSLVSGSQSQGGRALIGGAFNWADRGGETTAGIGADVGITTSGEDAGVAVVADRFDQVIAVTPGAGTGAGIAGTGMVTVTRMGGASEASVSRSADVTAASLGVQAEHTLSLWSVSGAYASGEQAAFGFAVAVNDLQSDTRAWIGDNADRAPDDGTDTAGETGEIRVDEVAVTALSEGSVGSAAVAGASAGGGQDPGRRSPGQLAGRTTNAMDSRTGGSQNRANATTATGDTTIAEQRGNVQQSSGQTPSGNSGQKKQNGQLKLAGAGSVTVTLAELATESEIDGADIAGRPDGGGGTGPVDVAVRAITDADMLAFAGGAAVSRSGASGGGGGSGRSVAVTGALALNDLGSTTEARLVPAALEAGGGAVTVDAITAGDQIAVALGLAATPGGGNSSGFTLAGSGSVGVVGNTTRAEVAGDLNGADTLDLTAYDRTRIANGGGALSVGSRGGVGAAVTVGLVDNTVDAAITGGSVDGGTAVSLRALSGTRVLGGAAAVSAATGQNGIALAGSAVYNQVASAVTARVENEVSLGADAALGDVTLAATGTAGDPRLDGLLDARTADGDTDFDLSGTQLADPADEPPAPDAGDDAYADADTPDDTEDPDASYDTGESTDLPGIDLGGEVIVGVAGNVSAGSKGAVGLSFAGNVVDTEYAATLDARRVNAGAVSVTAEDRATVVGLAVGAAASSQGFAGVGSVTYNDIDSRAVARIGSDDEDAVRTDLDASALTADARNRGDIYALAGSVAFSAKAGVGIAVGYNAIGTGDEPGGATAEVVNADLDLGGGDAAVGARSTAGIYSAALSGAAGNQAAIAGSVNVNRVEQGVTARLNDVGVTNAGQVDVTAGDSDEDAGESAEIWAVAGDVKGAGKVGVGVSLATSLIGSDYTAEVKASDLTLAGGLDVDAASAGTIRTLAASGGLAGQVAAGAAAATGDFDAAVTAKIKNSDVTVTGGDVTVAAADASRIQSFAAALQAAGTVALGGAVTVNTVDNTVNAALSGTGTAGAGVDAEDVVVAGDSAASIGTVALGAAGGGKVGLSGSVATSVLRTATTATIDGGAQVDAAHNVGVFARSEDRVGVFAGGAAIGGAALGAAGSVSVNVLETSAEASIRGAATDVIARQEDPAQTLTASTGRMATAPTGDGFFEILGLDFDFTGEGSVEATEAEDIDYSAPSLGTGTREVGGVVVDALSLQQAESAVATVGFSANVVKGGVGAAGSVNTTVMDGTTTALIEQATIGEAQESDKLPPTGGDVTVVAGHHNFGTSLVFGGAGGSAGAAGAATVDVFSGEAVAAVRGADIYGTGTLDLDAASSRDLLGIAVGAAGGAYVGLAGSGGVTVFGGETLAEVAGTGTVDMAAVDIDADSRSRQQLVTLAGSASLGAAAAGTFAVAVSESRTTARIGRGSDAEEWAGTPTVTTSGGVSVDAANRTEVDAVVASVGVGGNAVAGAVSAAAITNDTTAAIRGASVDAGGAVGVRATDTLRTGSLAGGLALSGGGAAVGVNIGLVKSRTLAEIAGGSVTAGGALDVTATRDADLTLDTYLGALGGGFQLSGGVGVLVLGESLDNEVDDDAEGDLGDELGPDGGDWLGDSSDFASRNHLESDAGQDGAGGEDLTEGGLSDEERSTYGTVGAYDFSSAAYSDDVDATTARIAGAAVDAGGTVTVHATDRTHTRNRAGAFSLGGLGAGGVAAVTQVRSQVLASVLSPDLRAGALDVQARSTDGAGGRAVDISTVTGSAGLVGLGAGVGVGRLEGSVRAEVGGSLTLTGGASVGAIDSATAEVEALGAQVGASAAGVVLAFADKDTTVDAGLAVGTLTAAGDVTIAAASGGRLAAKAQAASGGIGIAATGAYARARDRARVDAGIDGGANLIVNGAHAVLLQATNAPRAIAETLGVALSGNLAIGASIADASAEARVNAHAGRDPDALDAGDSVPGANIAGDEASLTVNASSTPAEGTDAAYAKANAGAGSFLASGAGADADARHAAQVRAYLGAGTQARNGGTVSVDATARPKARAVAEGIAASAGAAFGAALADATAATGVAAFAEDDVTVSGAGLDIAATVVPRSGAAADADAFAGAGGGLVGTNGAWATARNNSAARAYTGSGVALPAGDVSLRAVNTTQQRADAEALSFGFIAGGLIKARAFSDTVTLASLGADSRAAEDAVGDITISAFGENRDRADATSGTGGVVAGSAAEVETATTADTRAILGGGHAAELEAGTVRVDATQRSLFRGTVDSTRASIAGASGARARHNVDATVRATVGGGARLRAADLALRGSNVVRQEAAGDNVSVAAGGFLNGSAGRADTTLRTDTFSGIGDGAVLRIVGDPADEFGDLVLQARNDLQTRQRAKLDTGGAVDIARVEAHVDATSLATTRIGAGADLEARGSAVLAALTDADLESRGTARTHGLAGFAQGRASATLDADHRVTVASGARLLADDAARLYAGYDAEGRRGRMSSFARVYLWNKTALPIENDPQARGELFATNGITMASGSAVTAGGDAVVRTSQGQYSVRGEGRGKDLYREVAEKVGNFFVGAINALGGDVDEINLEIRRDSQLLADSDWVRLDGRLTGGAATYQYILIDREGEGPLTDPDDLVIETSPGVGYSITTPDIRAELEAQLAEYEEILDAYEQAEGSEDYEENSQFWIAAAQKKTLEAQLDALDSGDTVVVQVNVDDVTTRGGEVFIETSSLGGNGEMVLAPVPDGLPPDLQPEGAPGVLMLNRTQAFLAVEDVTVRGEAGGITLATRNDVFGVPVPRTEILTGRSAYNGIDITGPAAVGGQPEVVVVNDFDPPEGVEGIPPWIRLEGRIDNPFGLVEVQNRRGSIVSTGEINAATVNLRAGGDFVQYYRPGVDSIGGTEGDGSRIFGGRVYINAQYIDVNGLIQSGIPVWDVTFGAEAQAKIDAHREDWLADREASNPWLAWLRDVLGVSDLGSLFGLGGLGGGAASGSGEVEPRIKLSGGSGRNIEWGTLSAWYNAEEDYIELAPESVDGGYVFLFGHILSTGCEGNPDGCGIKVRSGYGDIRVDNQTDTPVLVRNLNVGEPVTGRVEIWDTGKADEQGNPFLTEYSHTVSGDGDERITRTTAQLALQETGDDVEVIRVDPVDTVLSGGDLSAPSGDDVLAATTYTPEDGFALFNTGTASVVVPGWLAELGFLTEIIGLNIKLANEAFPVEFIGATEGRLAVDSAADVIIDGGLRNPTGTTSVTSAGRIVNTLEGGFLQGARVDLEAATGLGSADNPIVVRPGSGGLRAVTAGGDVFLDAGVDTLLVERIATGDGHVAVNAAGDLLARDAGDAAVVSGGTLAFTVGGDLGAADRALRLDSGVGVTPVDGRVPLGAAAVNASAGGDIRLEEVAGDLQLERVASAGGDVHITVRDGDLVNAFQRQELDAEAIERLREIWQELRLTEAFGVGEAIEDSVAAREALVETSYGEYWQLRRLAEPDGSFDLDAQGQAILRQRVPLPEGVDDPADLDPAAINAYAAERLGELEGFLGEALAAEIPDGGSLQDLPAFQAFDQGFSFTAGPELRARIAEGAEWTEAQLLRGINADALIEVTDTQFENLRANLRGESITLRAPQGRIGINDAPVRIELPGEGGTLDFTDEQIAALVSAQPGDIALEGDAVIGPDGELVSGTVEALVVQRTRPLGAVHGSGGLAAEAAAGAGGDIFLAAPEALLALDGVSGGGDLRLQSALGLFSNRPGETVITGAGGGLLVEGGTGSIGTADVPLRLNLLPEAFVTARSTGGIHLAEADGALTVERMFSAEGVVDLTAPLGLLAFHDDALTDILAHDVRLQTGGAIRGGSDEDALDLELQGEGEVTAAAGAEVRLNAPEGDLRLDRVAAGADAALSAAGRIDGNSVYGDDTLDLAGPRDARVTLTAGAGIGPASQPLVLDFGALDAFSAAGGIHLYALDDLASTTIDAPAGPVSVEVDGALDFGRIRAGEWLRLRTWEDIDGEGLEAGLGLEAIAGFDRDGGVVTNADIRIAELTAQWAELRATGGVTVGDAAVSEFLNLYGREVDVALRHTGNAGLPLAMDVAGPLDDVAGRVRLDAEAADGLAFDRLYADDARLQTTANDVDIADGLVTTAFGMESPALSLWMHNREPAPRDVSVQLYAPDFGFFMEQDGRFVYTDAYVTDYRPGYTVRVPNWAEGRSPSRDTEGRSIERFRPRDLVPVTLATFRLPEPGPGVLSPPGPERAVSGEGGLFTGAVNGELPDEDSEAGEEAF